MSESDIVEKVSLSLRGSPYELSVCARLNTENPSLAIAIEHVPTGNCWKGDFAADCMLLGAQSCIFYETDGRGTDFRATFL